MQTLCFIFAVGIKRQLLSLSFSGRVRLGPATCDTLAQTELPLALKPGKPNAQLSRPPPGVFAIRASGESAKATFSARLPRLPDGKWLVVGAVTCPDSEAAWLPGGGFGSGSIGLLSRPVFPRLCYPWASLAQEVP